MLSVLTLSPFTVACCSQDWEKFWDWGWLAQYSILFYNKLFFFLAFCFSRQGFSSSGFLETHSVDQVTSNSRDPPAYGSQVLATAAQQPWVFDQPPKYSNYKPVAHCLAKELLLFFKVSGGVFSFVSVWVCACAQGDPSHWIHPELELQLWIIWREFWESDFGPPESRICASHWAPLQP